MLAARLVTRQLTVPKGLFTASSSCVHVSPCKTYYAPHLPVLFLFIHGQHCGGMLPGQKVIIRRGTSLKKHSSYSEAAFLEGVGAICWWLHTASHSPFWTSLCSHPEPVALTLPCSQPHPSRRQLFCQLLYPDLQGIDTPPAAAVGDLEVPFSKCD